MPCIPPDGSIAAARAATTARYRILHGHLGAAAACGALALLALLPRGIHADEAARCVEPPAGPPTVLEVPADELDALLKLQGKGIVLTYAEWRALLDAAKAKQATSESAPPEDAVRLSAEGTLDLADETAARFQIRYRIQGLAPGPRTVAFDAVGAALEGLRIEREGDAGPARYEEKDGAGRIWLDGPGVRTVTVEGSAVPQRSGPERRLDLTLPSPAAMSLAVTLPPGVRATFLGEGPALAVSSPADRPLVVAVRPTRQGTLAVAWSRAAQGAEGPTVLDAEVKTLDVMADGVVSLRSLVRVEILRTATDLLALRVPADLAIHAVEGTGVTGSRRSEDRERLEVTLEKPVLGPVEVLLRGERPIQPGAGVELPRIEVLGAVRHRGEVAVRFGEDVNARGVRVEGGRRVAPAGSDPAAAGALRYELARAGGYVVVDVEPGALRVDATGTYYLNLAEPGQTLIATVSYRVVEGTLFRLAPRFPAEFDLRDLQVTGAPDGFTRDVAADGTVEISLGKGVPTGGEIVVLATLERARAEWVPETGAATVPFAVPDAGATREEGYVAVGADAGFEVLDAGTKDLLAVGAADLTARGLSSAGLLYGYRLDGPAPELTLSVSRRAPLVEAEVVTFVTPGPRKALLTAKAIYRIQRAGVRRLFLDLPASAGDQVDLMAPTIRSSTRLGGERRPADVPEGYDRWQVDLEQRALGTYVVTAAWWVDLAEDDWTLPGSRPVAARVPLERTERTLVVRRSEGLEVTLPRLAATPDLRTLDVGDLPPEALEEPLSILEVLRLPEARHGVDIAVRKHGGAAVLNSLATEVTVETAVASEGILRTRAEVTLVNVDRQFLEVVLPPRSTLVGAVVDGRPVKPLVDGDGVLLVTVPSTLSAAPGGKQPADPRTRVGLTYETRLAGPVGGRLVVVAPRFPGLEVLRTTHVVGVEPTFEIASVGGDVSPRGVVRAAPRSPWILDLLGSLGGLASMRAERSASAPAAAPAEPSQTAGGYAAGKASAEKGAPARPAGPGGGARGAVGGRRSRGAEIQREVMEDAEVADHVETDSDLPELGEPMPTPSPATPSERPPPMGGLAHAPPVPPQAPAKPAEPPAPGAEEPGAGWGGAPGDAKPAGERAAGPGPRGRRGQLSLDVPVFLAPHRIAAYRIGGGGTVQLEIVSRDAGRRSYHLLLLASLGIGLLLAGTRRLPGPVVVAAGVAVAALLALGLSDRAGAAVAAVADGTTALAVILGLRWLALRLFRPRKADTPGRVPPAAAAALLLGLLAGTADPASAEEDPPAPASPEPTAPSPAGTIRVPRDPARGVGLAPEDRVFVPLTQWLELQRRAHPDRDPELAALGRVVTLLEASYRVEVTGEGAEARAEGSARLSFSQRGPGLQLVALSFPGLAIREARLNGEPVRLLLDGAVYRVAFPGEGDHVLDLQFHVPVGTGPAGRSFAFGVPTFAGATLQVDAADFDGEMRVSGAGRVVLLGSPATGEEFSARAYLGRPVGAGTTQQVAVTLAERSPEARPTVVRTRAETRTVHSLRDAGTESVVATDVHVLQGKATTLEFAVPAGVEVLEAQGPQVARWETAAGLLRLVLAAPAEGRIPVRVRTFRAGTPERAEALPEVALRDTTGESGLVIVNADPSLRVEVETGPGLFRTARPPEADAAGPDGGGRVAGAWRFAARPASVGVKTLRTQPRLEATTRVRTILGADRVRSVLEARVRVARAALGDLVFLLPGEDELRAVDGPDLEDWWLEGSGEERRLHVRFTTLAEGERAISLRLDRRLGGARDDVPLPRLALRGAQEDRGTLLVFALADVEPIPRAVPGWTSLAPTPVAEAPGDAPGARVTHGFTWEAPPKAPLTVQLRVPDEEVEAVVVTQVSPNDVEQRLEHLLLFDVKRGSTDRLAFFLPDGGLSVSDVVRARDLREIRSERATRKDVDGKEVAGLLYTLRLQSRKSGLVEVTVSQLWPAGGAVRVLRPEGVKATRWFSLLRTFLDGEVEARVGAGTPDPAEWADLPFVPTGLLRTSVLRSYAARAPFTLEVTARRHRLETEAQAVVLSAKAEVVVGLDGEARVRVRYRLFNRARQFLAVRLPQGAVLYGAVAAGRAVKPLAGEGGGVRLPIPKVPLGGTGYEVALVYRAKAGPSLSEEGTLRVPLPEVEGVEVDRTAVTLRLPEGFSYDFETKMTEAGERDVLGDDVESVLREAQEVLKVAETGTLEQRLFACDNAAPLVEQARRQLEQYKQRAPARGDRARALEAEVEKILRVQQAATEQCRIDAGTAWNDSQFERNNALGDSNANGQVLVMLDDATNGLEPQTVRQVAQAGANWRFNPESVPVEQAGKKELVELKQRIQGELRRRGLEDRAKSVDLAQVEESRAEARRAQTKGPQQQEGSADEQTLTYEVNRNNLLLNDRLREVQTATRQLGVGDLAGPVRPTSGLPAGGGGGGSEGRGFDLYAGDGAAPDGRRDGLEYRFAEPLEPVTRAGLMGVDVPLPTDGQVFRFVGPRAGSAIEVDPASEEGAGWLRILGAVVGFLAVAVGLLRVALSRRAA